MRLHGALKIFFRGAGFESELRVEGVEFEEIAMRFAGRRARAAIADFAEVVAALESPVRSFFGLGEILRE